MIGSLIATTTEGDVQWLMAAGQSLGLAVAQLRHHLARNLSPAHAALLAEPVEDIVGRTTDWYGQGQGPATPLEQQPPGPRAAATNAAWALLRDIRAEGDRLAASADADERVLGAMLEKVSHVPDLSFVQVRGERPILVAWGHGRAGQSIDLVELLKPIDVPLPSSPSRPAWLVPVLILAAILLAVGLLLWTRRQPDEVVTTIPPPPARIVLVPPAESPAPATAPPQTTIRPAAPATTTTPIATPTPTPTPITEPPSTPPPLTPSPTVSPRSAAVPEARPPTPERPSGITEHRRPIEPRPTPPPPDTPTSAEPSPVGNSDNPPATDASGGSPEPRPRSDAIEPPLTPPPAPTPPVETAAAPPPPQTVQLPPHASEPAPSPHPFTEASVHDHDLALLQGCWNLRGSFATADVETRTAAIVSKWRACFIQPQPGAPSLTGTQSLGWADGMTCSGPVTARFTADDKLEIADAADCLGDRTLFRMTEQCDRKDDATMICAWTAHDHITNADVHGEGLSLTPAR